jgi:UDP-N-acetylmuramoyl-L-alanyl-D-glutamate--2,6-diaminopimelate ligase
MFKENKILNWVLKLGRKIIPKKIFKMAQPIYHWGLSMLGGLIYGFPSRSLKVIAVTGTKGKSTTVFMVSKILEEQGRAVAACGSLGFKIRNKEWPNTLKMTMPGRTKLQKFLYQAKRADAEYVVLEATSEGIVQQRLAGVAIDCAVFTNLHREHLEGHGSFENYIAAKQKLFLKTHDKQVLNIDDPYYEKFANYPAKEKVTYGARFGDISQEKLKEKNAGLKLKLLGDFNEQNALAALAVAKIYNLNLERAIQTLNSIETIPGRMEILRTPSGAEAVIDYAHTPDSLRLVYRNLKDRLANRMRGLDSGEDSIGNRLICVLGAAGGGRDKWKRPEFGKIAEEFCDHIVLTNEDPFEESPEEIVNQIKKGFSPYIDKYEIIMDREEAIKKALTLTKEDDIVVITGKGSETSMAVAGGRKIPWSEREVVEGLLK